MCYAIPMGRKRNKKPRTDPGLGFSPYRQSVSMTRTPSVRALKRRARKQAKRDIERGTE